MTVRIGLVGARPQVALMVAGIAAGSGAEVMVRQWPDPGHSTGEGSVGVPLGEVAACDLVLVDLGAVPGGVGPGPGARRLARVVGVHLEGERVDATARAGSWGADHLVELPAGQPWLTQLLTTSVEPSTVLAVLGAVGGGGATTVALGCAVAAGSGAWGRDDRTQRGPSSTRADAAESAAALLVDADPMSTGLDLPLGIDDEHGGRWSSIPAGGSALVADSLRASLPHVVGMVVLTGPLDSPADPRIDAVLRTGRADFPATVLDAGRGPAPAGLGPRDAAAVVVPATLAGVVGAHRIVAALPTRRIVLAVRPTGWLPVAEVAAQVGVDCVVEVPTIRGLAEHMDCGDALKGRAGRALRRLGRDIWGALA